MADSTNELKTPVLVVGGTRSGTSMLCKILASAPGMCLWYEPNIIWRIGTAYRRDDSATEADAKPWVRRRIRRLFLEHQRRHNGARIVEKTPQNVVRIPFCNAVFPEAKFVHIYRDGRANLRSQVEKFETFRAYNLARPNARRTIFRRLSSVPFWEWPAYAPRAVEGLWRSNVAHTGGRWWGLRYPGWRADRGRLSTPEIAARQWVESVRRATADLGALPADRVLTIRYEDLTREPVPHFRRIVEFCGIDADEEFFERVGATVHSDSIERWRHELDPEALELAMPIMGDLLEELGYS